jgi:hypothetical protein
VIEKPDSLSFPEVDFDTFYTTMSLMDHPDIDPETQTRIRYHTKATIVRGTYRQARETLKQDFYGPRILWYQKYFNCSQGICSKRALNAVQNLHLAIKSSNSAASLKTAIAPFFTNTAEENEYLITSGDEYYGTFKSLISSPSFKLSLTTPIELFVLPDYRVVSVEDILSQSILDSQILTRIVIYQFNEFGQIVSARLYDKSLSRSENKNAYSRAVDYYYDVLKLRDIDRIRGLFTADAVYEDPTGFIPPRTFESVYRVFKPEIMKEFAFQFSPLRTYTLGNQVVSLVDANVHLTSGLNVIATPIQIFTLNDKLQISHYEALFKPKFIDFTKIDEYK